MNISRNKQSKIKLLVVLGEGGHTAELLSLVDRLDDRYELCYVVSKEDNLSADRIRRSGPVRYVTRPRGKKMQPFRAVFRTMIATIESLLILLQLRPNAVLSTGPALTVPFAMIGKLMGTRMIFVETGSRIEQLSMTGRILYPLADLFFVQWPQLEAKLSKALYAGALMPSIKREAIREGSEIFVTVGSTDFDDLVKAVDLLAPTLKSKGSIQIGHGRYVPKNWPYFRFAPDLDVHYERAAVVIAHGGLATTMEVLLKGLPLVSVNNPDRYDNHQAELLSVLRDEGYLIWCRDLNDLNNAVETARKTTFREFQPRQSTIHLYINEFFERRETVD